MWSNEHENASLGFTLHQKKIKDQKPNDLRDHRGFFKMGISQKNQQGLL